MKTLPYVYCCTHKITKDFYFGFRSNNKTAAEFDLGIKYFTSSKYVKSNFSNFDYEVIAIFFDPTSAYEFEQSLIIEHWGNPKLLNLNYGGRLQAGMSWFTNGKTNIYCKDGMEPNEFKKGRINVTGRNMSGENNPMFGKCGEINPNFGKKRTEEFKIHQSKIRKGIPKSEEQKKKQSEAMKGKPGLSGDLNPSKRVEVKEKIRASRIGSKASEETKEKMRLSKLGKKRGPYKKKLSPEGSSNTDQSN